MNGREDTRERDRNTKRGGEYEEYIHIRVRESESERLRENFRNKVIA